ncbi:PbsX family transcriptional regulator [Burkholderia sp. L27(2015)]|uniref:AbrB/MazE/SpoVT family DNA-binding domain-containing protein n=1 Tax=Burkholderia sp. L27(2015) TaxID=1641858 RepID=UPI00131E1BA4|nr:PbsX family transcriptional regulator [Burkholderia sp. L27(2015)]
MAKTATPRLKERGNTLAARLPATVAGTVRYKVGQEVEISTQEVGLAMELIGPRKPTLAERLERFDPEKHDDEAMATGPIRAEVPTAHPQANTQAAPQPKA